MDLAIFLLPVLATVAHYILADAAKPHSTPCRESDCC
jgi:hypothetical protein